MSVSQRKMPDLVVNPSNLILYVQEWQSIVTIKKKKKILVGKTVAELVILSKSMLEVDSVQGP